jgi:cytochrome c
MHLFSFTRILLLIMLVLTAGFVGHLGLRGLRRFPVHPEWQVFRGDPQHGREAVLRYGCGGCHVIQGVRDARGRVGPHLVGLREQVYLAGVLTNTPENLILWVQSPQDVNPLTAMPNLGVTDEDARHIAAFLYGAHRGRPPTTAPRAPLPPVEHAMPPEAD